MKKKIAEKWMKALESGQYKQGRGKLCNIAGDRFCCLGVLTNLYCEEKGKDFDEVTGVFDSMEDNDVSYEEAVKLQLETTDLPRKVQKWAGIKGGFELAIIPNKLHKIFATKSSIDLDRLALLNDGIATNFQSGKRVKATFKEISKIIKQVYRSL